MRDHIENLQLSVSNPGHTPMPSFGDGTHTKCKSIRVAFTLFPAVILALVILACGPSSDQRTTFDRPEPPTRNIEGFASINIAINEPPQIALVSPIPGFFSIRPGQSTRLSAVGFDQSGREIDDLTFQWRVADESAGIISASGFFQASANAGFYSGALAVRAIPPEGWRAADSEGFVDVAINTTTIDRSPASIQLFPRVAEAAPGQPIFISALALDEQGLLLPGGQTSWEMVDNNAGSINQRGRFVAGPSIGFYPEAILVTLSDGRDDGISALMDVRVLDGVQLPPSLGLNILPRTVVVEPNQPVDFEVIALRFQSGERVAVTSAKWVMLNPMAGIVSQNGRFLASMTPGVYPDAVEVSFFPPEFEMESREILTARATITILDAAPLQSDLRIPARVSIIPDSITLSPGESASLGIVGFDAEGMPLSLVDIEWSLDPKLGEIISFTKVTAGNSPGTYPGAIRAVIDLDTGDGLKTYQLSSDLTILGPLETIVIEPKLLTLKPRERGIFRAISKDASGNILPNIVYRWSVLDEPAGTIDANGIFTASQNPGQYENVVRVEATQITRP